MIVLSEAKHEARRAAGERRRRSARLAAEGRETPPGERAAERFVESISVAPGEVVSAYWPIRDELDVRPLMSRLHDAGVRVVLPVVVRRGAALVFRAWTPDTEMLPGAFGVPVPPPAAPVARPDFLVVPLLAFDRRGYRLGYGGGYYDRTLAALRAEPAPVVAVGYAYREQEVAAVPRGPRDQPLDWIVTEHEAWRVRK